MILKDCGAMVDLQNIKTCSKTLQPLGHILRCLKRKVRDLFKEEMHYNGK